MQQNRWLKTILLLIGAFCFGLYHYVKPASPPTPTPSTHSSQTDTAYQQATEQIRTARLNPNAKFRTIIKGEVLKLLPDDNEGARHQRFLVKLAPDIVVLVAHNLDLAKRVPAQSGQPIIINGEFIANDKGGVMHWTHHDPQGGQGGWIEYRDQRYQ
ncbi:MAG: DUF3465 domain-containing protein [Thiotrichaceae bacterium]|jgi:hypothetical protein|uniref:DUF3465 domain-containing protein n=1 Tax=Candidatus Thiocaldithrix dubininis TaxID=3080823 RepID=A0AA95H9U2_9GAMM|nr:MAG: DUF3465 domain-containing protein [Candidatus Thiocaldithrix dubininis]